MNSVSEQRLAATAMGLRSEADATHQALRVRSRDRDRAVPLSELDAVIDCPPMTTVPAAPEWLLGIAAYRGGLLPVVDLAAACGDEASAAGAPGERLLLVETGVHRLAFSVDEILSRTPEPVPADGSPIALRQLAARLLGTAHEAHPDSVEPAAR